MRHGTLVAFCIIAPIFTFLGFDIHAAAKEFKESKTDPLISIIDSIPDSPAIREHIKNNIVIVMIDDKNTPSRKSIYQILTELEKTHADVIVLDALFSKRTAATSYKTNIPLEDMQKLFNMLSPRLVWVADREDKTQEALIRADASGNSLPLGSADALYIPSERGNEMALRACEKDADGSMLPHFAFLAWEIKNGKTKLPYHQNCNLWKDEYAWLPRLTDNIMPIKFFGKEGFFTTISSTALVTGAIDSKIFDGKIVLIGSNLPDAFGKIDRLETSAGKMNGTETAAHAIATIEAVSIGK